MPFAEEFKNPSKKYRIKPFWFWNGDLKEAEIEKQIKEMEEKGLGGFFICARQGMSVPYLSQKWFDLVEFASKKAKEVGLEAWLYDEYPYPSGMSGGEVLLEHPEAEHMILNHISKEVNGLEEIELNLGWSTVIYAKAFPIKEDEIIWEEPTELKNAIGNLQTTQLYQTTGLTKYNNKRFFTYNPQKILTICLPEGKWHIEIYTQSALGEFKYYGGFFDPCNKAAVKTFLDTTHQRYKEAIGESFGQHVQGMFSDEVGLLSPIPWSKLILDYFEKEKGYRLTDVMPALHNRSYKNAVKIRFDLYDALHKLFVESYHKQVADWCKENNLFYATEVPSMRMSTQRYSTIVGGDTAHEKLGKSLEWIYDEYIRNYRSNAKSVSSLTRQLGNEFAMIESFHSVGWTMTMQDAKWMIDRLGASGINLYNFHAFYYTIDAITKHDAPPSQFIQNPYWKNYKVLADYVGRMGAFITNTEAVIKIAVLDPVASFWSYLANPFHGFGYRGEDKEEEKCLDKLREDWVSICKTLLFHQLDYDHLDVEILQDAFIEEGNIKIGKASYELLIIPPSICFEDIAYQKVKEFAEQGGKIVALGMIPNQLIGQNNDANSWQELFGVDESFEEAYFKGQNKKVSQKGNINFFGDLQEYQWITWCETVVNRPIEVILDKQNQKDIISCIREDKEGNYYLFVANQGADLVSVQMKNNLKKQCEVFEYVLENGDIKDLKLTDYKFNLLPFESRCIQLKEVDKKEKIESKEAPQSIIINTQKPMKVKLNGFNILRLDEFVMSKDKINWYPCEVKTFIEQCVENQFLQRENLTFQGDFGTPKKILIEYPLSVYYKTTFEVEELSSQLFILMDRGTIKDEFVIRINEYCITKDEFKSIFVNDFNNIICDIAKYVKIGTNLVEIQTNVTKDSDGLRDPLYLYGEFGVKQKESGLEAIAKMPQEAIFDLNYIKGFPYYSGTFEFEAEIQIEDLQNDYLLEFDFEQECHECIELSLNGVDIGVKAFSPYIWSVDRTILNKGSNTIKIQYTNTLGNMLDGTFFDYEKHQLIKIKDI